MKTTYPHTDRTSGYDSDNLIERISWGETCLAYIIRAGYLPNKTTFLTPPEFKQQVGYVVYPAGGEINRHAHLPLERQLVGTSEVLILRRGRCEIDIFISIPISSRCQRAGNSEFGLWYSLGDCKGHFT